MNQKKVTKLELFGYVAAISTFALCIGGDTYFQESWFNTSLDIIPDI